MPSINELYQSEWLKGPDLLVNNQPRAYKLTIQNLELRPQIRRDGTEGVQLVLYFNETQKKLGLNAGNARAIAAIHGDDYSQWGGRQISLRPIWKKVGANDMWLLEVFDERSFQFADMAPNGGPTPAPGGARAPASPPPPPGPVMSGNGRVNVADPFSRSATAPQSPGPALPPGDDLDDEIPF